MDNLAYLGMACALCFSALGSGFGTGCAGQSAVGGWKKCYAAGKPAPFILVGFAGAPLTQTIYGFSPTLCCAVGILAGLAIGISAWFQGKIAAAACDALSETGKGTANYFIVIGIAETVALFTLVFSLLVL